MCGYAQAKIQGGLSPRPLLSVPHILADESSCYYHGYVLAEMSVHQTRDYFTEKLGAIVDNEQVSCSVLTDDSALCCHALLLLYCCRRVLATSQPVYLLWQHAASLLAGPWSCCCCLATPNWGLSDTHPRRAVFTPHAECAPHPFGREQLLLPRLCAGRNERAPDTRPFP